jgi:Na+-driven multidrug efflux pump
VTDRVQFSENCKISFFAAASFSSVRVSNELGANRPKAAKFSVVMAVSTSGFIGAIFMAVFLIWRTELPRFFSDDDVVLREAAKLGYLLAASIFLNSIQPVLSGIFSSTNDSSEPQQKRHLVD